MSVTFNFLLFTFIAHLNINTIINLENKKVKIVIILFVQSEQVYTYVGPLEDHVYWLLGSFSIKEYCAAIMAGETMAPTPSITKI